MTDNALQVRDENIYVPELLRRAAFTRQPHRVLQPAHAGSLRR